MSETQPTTELKPTATAATEFERQADEAPPGLIAEFGYFLIHNKKWWLTPIIIVLLLVTALVFLGSTYVAPFVYPIFG